MLSLHQVTLDCLSMDCFSENWLGYGFRNCFEWLSPLFSRLLLLDLLFVCYVFYTSSLVSFFYFISCFLLRISGTFFNFIFQFNFDSESLYIFSFKICYAIGRHTFGYFSDYVHDSFWIFFPLTSFLFPANSIDRLLFFLLFVLVFLFYVDAFLKYLVILGYKFICENRAI